MEAFKSQAIQALLNDLIKAEWKYLRSMRKSWITLFIFDTYWKRKYFKPMKVLTKLTRII